MPQLIDASDGHTVRLDHDFANSKAMLNELVVHPELIPKDGLYAVSEGGTFRLILKHDHAVCLPTFDTPI